MKGYGTIVSRMDIVRAVEAGARHQTLPFVRPGGEMLLRVDSRPKVAVARNMMARFMENSSRIERPVISGARLGAVLRARDC